MVSVERALMELTELMHLQEQGKAVHMGHTAVHVQLALMEQGKGVQEVQLALLARKRVLKALFVQKMLHRVGLLHYSVCSSEHARERRVLARKRVCDLIHRVQGMASDHAKAREQCDKAVDRLVTAERATPAGLADTKDSWFQYARVNANGLRCKEACYVCRKGQGCCLPITLALTLALTAATALMSTHT